MNREALRSKISGIKKGTRVQIIPMSMKAGDAFTAFGIPCSSPARKVYELDKPFYANLENFDGESIWISSEEHFCLKIPYDDLRDVSILLDTHKNIARSSSY